VIDSVLMFLICLAFYASVEIRDNPSLKGKPVAVGGMSMISTSSYEARKMGVRSAMPGFIGKQLCPELIFVKPNFDKYKQVSTITRYITTLYEIHISNWHDILNTKVSLNDEFGKLLH
jgi:nucleotidyltransferase/DNA polymerase involved in DNA repair